MGLQIIGALAIGALLVAGVLWVAQNVSITFSKRKD